MTKQQREEIQSYELKKDDAVRVQTVHGTEKYYVLSQDDESKKDKAECVYEIIITPPQPPIEEVVTYSRGPFGFRNSFQSMKSRMANSDSETEVDEDNEEDDLQVNASKFSSKFSF
jgi:hypothetical protein